MMPTRCVKITAFAVIATIPILFFTIFVLILQLHNIKTELAVVNARIDSIVAYPIASSQPPVLLKVTYIELSGKELHMQVYDNNIDVGNQIINDKLTEFFLQHREHNLLCSSDSIPVRINEEKDKARVIVNLPETIAIFNIYF